MTELLYKSLKSATRKLYMAFTILLILVPFSVKSHAQSQCAISLGYNSNIEQILTNSPIVRTQDLKEVVNIDSHVTTVRVVTLKSGMRGIWKPRDNNWASSYVSEVLSYELDKIFTFNLIPPTVIRMVSGEIGSLQLFIEPQHGPPTKLLTARRKDSSLDPISADRPILDLLDYLIDNTDRHQENYLHTHTGQTIAIDHGLSLGNINKNNHVYDIKKDLIIKIAQSIRGRELLIRIRGTNKDSLKQLLRTYLNEKDTQSFFERLKLLNRISSEVI